MAVTTSTQLRLATLGRLPADARPAVRPDAIVPGILHLGLGAFHRAHQAIYTEQAIAAAGGDWGIVGVAPRSREIVQRLQAQDGLYSVVTIAGAGARPRVIGSLAELRHAASAPHEVVARIADPAIHVVTMTITEKAYQLGPKGKLHVDDVLQAQLSGALPPTSVPALLARGLMARAAADAGPIAIVSCDNLPTNGTLVRGLIEQALMTAAEHATDTADRRAAVRVAGQLGGAVTFPATMVDRIVPATTSETLRLAREGLGMVDRAPVAAEPYRQWVVEDRFPGGRPAWELAGAVLTTDVAPWEALKLRILNAVYSALAYLGALASCETTAEALALPGSRAVMERFVADDVVPTLTPPPGEPPQRYASVAFERLANPALGHRTFQVATDGTQKLPYRLLGTIADRLDAGAVPRWAALVLAAWMRFARGTADNGTPLPLDDPLAAEVRAAISAAPDTPAGLANALFELREVMPVELAEHDPLRELVVEWLTELDRHGAAETLRGAARIQG